MASLRPLPTTALLVLLAVPPAAGQETGEASAKKAPAPALRPTLTEIFKPPTLLGQRPRLVGVSADGAYALFSWAEKDEEKPKRDLYVVSTAGEAPPRRLFGADEKARVWWTRRDHLLLVHRGGWLEALDAGDPEAKPRPLMEVGPRLANLVFLEDGRRVAFSAGEGDGPWLLDLETGQRRRPAAALEDPGAWFEILEQAHAIALFARPGSGRGATDPDADQGEHEEKEAKEGADGEGEARKRVLYLVPLREDGVVRETGFEEGGRVTLSRDGRFAARMRRSRDLGRQLVIADFLSEHVTTLDVRSSLPGDPGFRVDLELYDLEADEAFPPPLDEGRYYWLSAVEWCPVAPLLLVHRVSNDFHVRQVLVVDAQRRSARPVLSERDDAWIGGPLLHASWLGKSRRVAFTSERTGFNHLYVHDLESGDTRALTPPDARFEVHAFVAAEDGRRALIVTNEEDPARRDVYALDLDDGERRRLTSDAGVAARPLLSLAGDTAVWLQEFPLTPAELYASPTDRAQPVRLTHTVPRALGELALPPPEIVEYENPDDGQTVRALLYKPPGFDPARRYPLVVFVHGAGYLQNVLAGMTSYDVNALFHQRLARKGYVVLDPDYRHSKGYGRKFRTDIYGYMGGKDLDDVVAGVRHLVAEGFVDPERVGIYGGSYGGFLTLMALFTKADVFACGAALRSVTDWRDYNAWYTNARLGDPKEHPENYERSSPIDHVEGLEDPLLLLHGLKDKNVFAQDSIRLIEKLVQLGKDFEVMLYPSQDHGFDDPESWIDEYRRIERLFDRHLGAAASGS